MDTAVAAFQIALVLLGGLVIVERLIRDSVFGVLLVLVAVYLDAVLFGLVLQWVIGPYTAHLMDIVAALLLMAAVGRLLRSAQLTTQQWLVIVFGLLVLFSIARALPVFDTQHVLNDARRFVYLPSAILYFSTVEPRPDLFDRIARIWLVAACVLAAVAALRWAVLPLGLSGGLYGPGDGMRVLWAREAFFLLQAFFISFLAWRHGGSRWWGRMAIVFLIAVILLQHRTVWAALLVGLAVLAVRDRRLTRWIGVLAISATLVGGVFVAAVLGDSEQVAEQLAASAQDEGTWRWRVDGWVALLEGGGVESPVEALVGRPFATSWARTLYGQVITAAPHNFYIETYLRVGLVGLGILLVVYLQSLRSLGQKNGPGQLLSAPALFGILATQLVYSVPYSLSPSDGLLLGLALSVAFSSARSAGREHTELAVQKPL